MTQPIRLVLPDLFQDRLAKLTEHAAHVDMVIGAVAQHDLRVAQRSRRAACRVSTLGYPVQRRAFRILRD